jgi:GR25 family glycosyltransferase involved in LPS biosynthesis
MPSLNDFFSEIVIINLDHRTDRWRECEAQMKRFSFTATRFSAFFSPDHGETRYLPFGTTASHRAIMDTVCFHGWPSTLILEDDFKIIHDDFNERISSAFSSIPDDWDILYLGGNYAAPPLCRVSNNLIRASRMHTLSSYALRPSAARKLAPHFYGMRPADEIASDFLPSLKAYVLQPRLMIQRPSYSDLTHEFNDYSTCMLDESHEKSV